MAFRTRLFVEAAVAAGFALIALVTLLWPDWIELAFGVDPDLGDGSLEGAIVAVAGGIALASLGLARSEWRRARRDEVTHV